jgi:hypothetical protein
MFFSIYDDNTVIRRPYPKRIGYLRIEGTASNSFGLGHSFLVEITQQTITLFEGAVSIIKGFYYGQKVIESGQKHATGSSVAVKPRPTVVSK